MRSVEQNLSTIINAVGKIYAAYDSIVTALPSIQKKTGAVQ